MKTQTPVLVKMLENSEVVGRAGLEPDDCISLHHLPVDTPF